MTDPATIDEKNVLSHAEDYNFLRKEGLKLIQDLAGKVWTDYNTHDPGITLLEALCYVLTDLGYRTSFDIKDILAAADQNSAGWQNIFYTARQVLPCNPVTLNDYRKLVIDTEGVRNAWIETSDEYEMLMYLQPVKSKEEGQAQQYTLSYDPAVSDDALYLRGLYKVFIEYETEVLYNKKEEEVAERVRQKLYFHRNLCEDFISVSSIEYEYFKISAEIQVSEGVDIEMVNARMYAVIHDFFSAPINFYTLEQMVEKGCSAEEIFEGPLLKYGFIDDSELELSGRYKDIHLSDVVSMISGIEGVIAIKNFTIPYESASPNTDFNQWINSVKEKQRAPRLDVDNSVVSFARSGDRHRRPAEKQPDRKRVKEIFLFLQSANFRSRLKGPAKDFPVPQGEFMNIAEYFPFQSTLPAAYGMSEQYIDDKVDASHIQVAVNELLDEKTGAPIRKIITGLWQERADKGPVERAIQAILDDKADGDTVNTHVLDLLDDKLDGSALKHLIRETLGEKERHQPVRDAVHALLQRKNEMLTRASRKTSELKRVAYDVLKMPLYRISSEEDIERLRKGYKQFQLARLQKRKKQALQLRGFLMVFEQILSDYLSQLAATRQLLSFDKEVKQTSFPRPLQDIPDFELLFIDYDKYIETQWRITETQEQFVDRRNKILDHLLGRYAETMEKYAYYLQAFEGKKAGKTLIEDKIAFMQDYIQVSNYRGKGFDYSNNEQVWNTDNVEGLKKRICRLLGMKDYTRKSIATDAIAIQKVRIDDSIERYVVILTDPDNSNIELLKSLEYEFETEAHDVLNYILEHGSEQNLYDKDGRKGRWGYQLKRATQENDFEVIGGKNFNRKEEMESAYDRTIEVLTSISTAENFHIIDHILLRPRINPRERTSKQGSVFNADAVDLLSVAEVAGNLVSAARKKEGASFRFKIANVKDDNRKDKMNWRLSLLKEDKTEMLVIKEDFLFYKHLTRRIEQVRQFGSDSTNYLVGQNPDGYFNFSIAEGTRVLAQSKKNYRVREEMDADILSLVKFFSYETTLINDKLDNYDDLSSYADPYSFQLSICIPSWPAKFRNPTFKHLLEKTIYTETPSHIYPHVYWLDHKKMHQFEEAYRLWLEEMAQGEIPNTEVVNNLVYELNEMRK